LAALSFTAFSFFTHQLVAGAQVVEHEGVVGASKAGRTEQGEADGGTERLDEFGGHGRFPLSWDGAGRLARRVAARLRGARRRRCKGYRECAAPSPKNRSAPTAAAEARTGDAGAAPRCARRHRRDY